MSIPAIASWSATAGATGSAPDLTEVLEQARAKGPCVHDLEYMRDAHMDVLDDWRTQVVRNGQRTTTLEDGREVMMSLTNTCLDCHGSKENFCVTCHDYVGIAPKCYDCHLDVKEAE